MLRIDAHVDAKRQGTCIEKNSKITIAGGELNASKTDALPNETITITGNGFGSQTCIPVANITLDSVPVMVTKNPYPTPADCGGSTGVEGFQLRPVRGHHHPVARR